MHAPQVINIGDVDEDEDEKGDDEVNGTPRPRVVPDPQSELSDTKPIATQHSREVSRQN